MQQLPEYLWGLTYKIDGRTRHPNHEQIKRRLGSFRRGWAAALKGEEYVPLTLRELKWDNYGYRLGMLEGKVDLDIQEELFEILLESQQRRLNQETEV